MAKMSLSPDRSERHGLSLLTLIVMSAFGPYLFGDVRTEQLVVYGLAAALLPLLLWKVKQAPGALSVVIGAWVAIITIALIGWLVPMPNQTPYATGSPFANLDNFVLPLACIGLTLVVVPPGDHVRAARRVAGIVVVGASINAVVGVTQLRVSLDDILSRWWAGDGSTGPTTAEQAQTMGRLTGFIGQPVLAGLLYSVGLVSVVYLLRHRPVWMAAVTLLLVIGGMLTVSKAFLLLGVPIAGWQIIRTSERRVGRIAALSITALVATAVGAWIGWLDQWKGAEMLLMLLPNSDQAELTFYLGNRFGETSSTRPIIDAVMSGSPVSGFGAPGLKIYTDTAWVQVMILSGLLGGVLFLVSLAALTVGYWRRRRWLANAERAYFDGVILIAVLGCLATPALTANRLSVVLWVLLTLAMSAQVHRPDHQRSTVPIVHGQAVVPAPPRRVPVIRLESRGGRSRHA